MREKIDVYLSQISELDQSILNDLRNFIKSLNPQFIEAMVYGVPGFKYKKKSLCCYAAFKNHLGFYPLSPEIIETFKKELVEFETAKGTIRFTSEHSIPTDLIKRMIEARVDEIDNN